MFIIVMITNLHNVELFRRCTYYTIDIQYGCVDQ